MIYLLIFVSFWFGVRSLSQNAIVSCNGTSLGRFFPQFSLHHRKNRIRLWFIVARRQFWNVVPDGDYMSASDKYACRQLPTEMPTNTQRQTQAPTDAAWCRSSWNLGKNVLAIDIKEKSKQRVKHKLLVGSGINAASGLGGAGNVASGERWSSGVVLKGLRE